MNRSLTNTPAAQATGVLTTTDVVAAGETVTIGTTTYTFRATLSTAYDVLLGAAGAASASLDNLKAAINGAAGAGTTYGTGTLPNTLVTATTKTSAALTVQAIALGAQANLIPTTTTMANATWAATTLTGGQTPSDLLTQTSAATGPSVAINDLNVSPYLIRLTLCYLTAAKVARFSFPDSVNAFGASLPGPAISFVGPISPMSPVSKSVSSSDYPGLRLHASGAVMRCNLDYLDSAATVTYQSEIEQPQ
jgi:hypothetical protein